MKLKVVWPIFKDFFKQNNNENHDIRWSGIQDSFGEDFEHSLIKILRLVWLSFKTSLTRPLTIWPRFPW